MEAFTVVLFLGPPIVNLAVPDLVSPLTDFAAARCFTTDEGNTAFRNAESFRAGWTFLGFTGAGITLLLMVVTFLDGRVMKVRVRAGADCLCVCLRRVRVRVALDPVVEQSCCLGCYLPGDFARLCTV